MPSFSIEAEGEANPLSAQLVLANLSSISGRATDQQSLQVVTQQLSNWEKLPGYYSILQDIYLNYSIDQQVRFSAIIQLKNGVDKHWRKTSPHPIDRDEKVKIRSQAISVGVDEPAPALALQNALVIAKIVRYEFPHDWPDAITAVISQLRLFSETNSNRNHTSNILNITLQIVKELAAGRLQRTKKSLESVSPELLSVLGHVYLSLVQQWSTTNQVQAFSDSYMAIKALRRLLVAGFEHPHRHDMVKQFWDLVQEHHDGVWGEWQQMANKQDHRSTFFMKHLFQYTKLYLEMARAHPASFVLLGCMDILSKSWSIIDGNDAKQALNHELNWSVQRSGDASDETSPIEKLALKALLLFRACVKLVFYPAQTFKYQHPQDKEDRKIAVDQIKTQVFSFDFVTQIMEILVRQYFVLRPADLREWEEEPDEWERREEEITEAWEFSVRSCSEKLFLDLVINFKELLVPKLLQVFEQYARIENQDVLLKDSLYSAVGIAAACIEDILDFNTFLRTVLVQEVLLDHPNYNLIRRRIAILLGQWVPIKPETLDRPSVYQIFTFMLSPHDKLNDHVVRVTAGRQLRLVLEPFEFKHEEFEPYAGQILASLMELISKTELTETKMALLETVRVAVTRMETRIEPHADAIMSMLPVLWSESGEEHLMKQAILSMITAIITSLGSKSVQYHGPILVLIHDSVQPGSEAIVYLLEEALDLWAAVLQHVTYASPELLTLASSLLPLLELGSDHLRQCFELLESYIALSPAVILEPRFLHPLLTSMKELLSIVSSARVRDASLAPRVVENLVAAVSVSADSEAAIVHLTSTMLTTGYLGELLKLLHQAYDYHQDPRPNRRAPDIIGIGETSLLTLLSRLCLASPASFVQAIDTTGQLLEWLVPEWIDHFDAISDTIRKKLQILGLNSLFLVTTPPPRIMLDSFQSIIGIWTDLLLELSEGAAEENQADYLWSGTTTDQPGWPDESPEDSRKRMIMNKDPIYTVNLRHNVAERFSQLITACGGREVFEREVLSGVDPVVMKGFTDLGIL